MPGSKLLRVPRVFSASPGRMVKIVVAVDDPDDADGTSAIDAFDVRRTPDELRLVWLHDPKWWIAKAAHRVLTGEKPHVIRIGGYWYQLALKGWRHTRDG
ncbi:hypothetical protein Nazgul01 [Burkholderia phage BcepNazgul]|uniref:Uncharacterized protein n=1 Tax=Burkholderia phage BcepNazgul TaxID=242861 RepID=Q6UYG4_9CAUD|nr:hypothetical protein Nazgul01 [Burkholderia phage BcepNazgul]AAQ63377.2 hypothetical protein Nazgul01 [Burkholderia phage BcepNazgul]